ncbi:MAG: adenine phosphoribosyltransferase [Burkholderiaceae bacterium]
MKTPRVDIEFLRSRVRAVPDWPKPGVVFRDITPLLSDPRSLNAIVEALVQRYLDEKLDLVAGIDARGFIIGGILAHRLNAGFIPVRKKGKLPAATLSHSYELEYGTGTVEIHADAARPGQRVLLVDDLIATGGTMLAGSALLRQVGAEVIECAAVIDLPELGGSRVLRETGHEVYALVDFAGE